MDIDQAGFLSRLRTSKALPKTAAPYPGDFIEAFERLTANGESVVCIHPSADLSGTVRSALTAREACPGADIRIVDTRTVAGPLASMVLEADRIAKAGASADQVETLLNGMLKRARIYFMVDTLDICSEAGASAARRPCSAACCRSSRS